MSGSAPVFGSHGTSAYLPSLSGATGASLYAGGVEYEGPALEEVLCSAVLRTGAACPNKPHAEGMCLGHIGLARRAAKREAE